MTTDYHEERTLILNENDSRAIYSMWFRVGSYGAYHHFQKYFSYIVAVSCIGEKKQGKPPTCRNSLTNFIT
jgi:hypothetical protein